jgi:hypothetical protein
VKGGHALKPSKFAEEQIAFDEGDAARRHLRALTETAQTFNHRARYAAT